MRSNLTLGEIIDRTTHAGFGIVFGLLAALLALVAIPFVGLSTPFGLAIAMLGAQMIWGRDYPWLPKRLRNYAVTVDTLNWLSTKVARFTRGLERWVKPRLTVLTRGPFWSLIGVGIVLQGVGLALPLPIPGSNWPFIFVILIYAIGLLEDDGVLILIGHALTFLFIILGIVFWHVVHRALLRTFAWLGHGAVSASQPALP